MHSRHSLLLPVLLNLMLICKTPRPVGCGTQLRGSYCELCICVWNTVFMYIDNAAQTNIVLAESFSDYYYFFTFSSGFNGLKNQYSKIQLRSTVQCEKLPGVFRCEMEINIRIIFLYLSRKNSKLLYAGDCGREQTK